MSAETAARLDLGFDVLAPSSVPSPFAGEPEVSASSGSYSLYWLMPDSPPTFLQIDGNVGGAVPAYSKFDRNVQLTQNATVNGAPAYRDQTPIYDLVYWQVGDVLYSVESRNLTSDDSLSIADGLNALTPTNVDGGGGDVNPQTPSVGVPGNVNGGDVIAVAVEGVTGATLSASAGVFPASGGGSIAGVGGSTVDWMAPTPDSETVVTFTLSDPTTAATLASASTTVAAASAPAPTSAPASIACPETVASGGEAAITVSGSGYLSVDAQTGSFPASGVNIEFTADAGGGASIAGTMPAGGSVELSWVAPADGAIVDAVLTVSEKGGGTSGQCMIRVTADPGASSDAGARSDVTALAVPDVAAASIGTGDRGDGTTILDPKGVESVDPAVQPTALPSTQRGASKRNQTDDGSGVVEGAKATVADVAPPTSAPAPKVKPSATVRPTATLSPATGDEGLISQVIGAEGGELVTPGGATVRIPPGAFAGPSTLTIRPVADGKLPVRAGIDLVPGTGFDITVASADGRAMETLAKPATLTIALDPKKRREGTRLYWINGSTLEGVGNATMTDVGVSASVSHFSRYVAGVPLPTTVAPARDWFKLGLLGLGAMFVLMIGALVAGSSRRRRHRHVRPRATPVGTRGR